MSAPADIRLIALDLDGTALDTDGLRAWLADDLVDVLNALGDRGVQWCTNSGRPHESQLELIQSCRRLVNMPVATLSGERYIHWAQPWYAPHEPFNSEMASRVEAMYPQVIAALAGHRDALRTDYDVVQELDIDNVLGWQIADAAQAAAFHQRLSDLRADIRDAQVLRNDAWVVVTHAMAGKDVILEETARSLNFAREQLLAIGDHHNDLDMLDGRVAGWVGCPGDADEEVKSTVRGAGGCVSAAPGARGTVDVITQLVGTVR